MTKPDITPITTLRLPAICPACAHRVLHVRDTHEGTDVTCQQPCGWAARYLVVQELPDIPRAVKGGKHLAFKKRKRVGPHR